MAPMPPHAPSAPAEPWRSSATLTSRGGETHGARLRPRRLEHGGPDMAPMPPHAPSAPAEPWRSSATLTSRGGETHGARLRPRSHCVWSESAESQMAERRPAGRDVRYELGGVSLTYRAGWRGKLRDTRD